jgi:hypothetical protein
MGRNLYKTIENSEMEASLYPRVLLAVEKAKKSFYLKVFGAWTTLAALFSPLTFLLLETLHRKLIESSTYEYISLLVNDADARGRYAKEILFAVYDTIPVMGVSVTLVSLFLVTVFYYKAMKSLTLLYYEGFTPLFLKL